MGWLRRALHGGRYDDRDRRAQLRQYVVACDRLVGFLDGHGDDHGGCVRERANFARDLLERGWTRDDLLALAQTLQVPWPDGKARDFGAVAPEYADEGDRLCGQVNEAALRLRAIGA